MPQPGSPGHRPAARRPPCAPSTARPHPATRPPHRPIVGARPAADPAAPVAGPAFLRGTFDTVAGADHFLRTDGWGKGLVWVNGFLLGRYWSAGPTATLYVPGPLLRAEGNEVVVLELHGAAAARVAFAAGPDLGSSEV